MTVRLWMMLATLLAVLTIVLICANKEPLEPLPLFSSLNSLEEGLLGKTAEEVVDLLGEPDPEEKSTETFNEVTVVWRYRCILLDRKSKLIVLNFDEKKRVTHVLVISMD